MTVVVGLVGEIAAGKGEAAGFLRSEYGAEVYRFSDILASVLEHLNMPVTRENLQALGRVLRTLFGENVLVEALRQDIDASNAEVVVVDGIRYPVEAEMTRSFENNILIYITAPEKIRFGRVRNRGTRGEKDITLAEFKRNEADETENAILRVGATADYKIQNTGTIEELHKKLRETLRKSHSRG